MPKYNVLDVNGEFMGTIEADDAEVALKLAKGRDTLSASVEERPEHTGHAAT